MRLLCGKTVTRILCLTVAFLALNYFVFTSKPLLTRLPSYHSSPPSSFERPLSGNSLKGIDPLLYDAGPPPGKLWYPGEQPLANATLLALVRNSEADGMVQSMLDLEHMFNSKFNYPWTFLNDVPFDEEFKRKTRAATNAEITYGTIFLFFFFFLFSIFN